MIRGGALLTAGALPLPALAWNLETLTAALLILGAALGLTEVAMNAQGVTLEQVIGRPVMSGLHGAYSIGGLLGALLGSGAAHLAVPLSTHLAVVSAGISVAAWFASGEALPDAEAPASPTRHGRNRWTGSVLLLGVIGLCSFVGEGTVENWSTVYLRDGLGAAAGVSGLGYAGCAGAMALVRLGGDRLVARFGPVTVVRAGSLVAVIGLTAVSAGVIAAIIGYTLFGAGVALIAPVAFSAAGKVPGIPSATAVSRVTGIAYLGFLGGPPLIGFTADLTGLGHAMLIPTALTVVITLLAKAVQPPSNRNGLS
jgi:hypothetical protein